MNFSDCIGEDRTVLSIPEKITSPRKKLLRAASCDGFDIDRTPHLCKHDSNKCKKDPSLRHNNSFSDTSQSGLSFVSDKVKLYESFVDECRRTVHSLELKKKIQPPPRRKRSKTEEHSDLAEEIKCTAHLKITSLKTEDSDVSRFETTDTRTEYETLDTTDNSMEINSLGAAYRSLETKTAEDEVDKAEPRSEKKSKIEEKEEREPTSYQYESFYRNENLKSDDIAGMKVAASSLKSIDVDVKKGPLEVPKLLRSKSKSVQSLITSTPDREEAIFPMQEMGMSPITMDEQNGSKSTCISPACTPQTFHRHKGIRRPSGFSQQLQSRRSSFQDPLASYSQQLQSRRSSSQDPMASYSQQLQSRRSSCQDPLASYIKREEVRPSSPVRASVSIIYVPNTSASNVKSSKKANSIGALTENEYLHVASMNTKKHHATKTKKKFLRKRIRKAFRNTTNCWPKSHKRKHLKRNNSSSFHQKKKLDSTFSNESFASLFLYHDKGPCALPDDLTVEPISSDIFTTDAKENVEFPPHVNEADLANKRVRRTLRQRLLHPKMLGTFNSCSSLDSAALKKAQRFLKSSIHSSVSKSKLQKSSDVEGFSPDLANETVIDFVIESKDTLCNIEEDVGSSPIDGFASKISEDCVSSAISESHTSKLSLKTRFFLRASSIPDLAPRIRKAFSKPPTLATTSEGDYYTEQEDEIKKESLNDAKSSVKPEPATDLVDSDAITTPMEGNEKLNKSSSYTQAEALVEKDGNIQPEAQDQSVKLSFPIPSVYVEFVSDCPKELNIDSYENKKADISMSEDGQIMPSETSSLPKSPAIETRLDSECKGEHELSEQKSEDLLQRFGERSLQNFNEENEVVHRHNGTWKTSTNSDKIQNNLLPLNRTENNNDSAREQTPDLETNSVALGVLAIENNETSSENNEESSGTIDESQNQPKDILNSTKMALDEHEKLPSSNQEQPQTPFNVTDNETNETDYQISEEDSELSPPCSLARENSVKQFAVKISPLSENSSGDACINKKMKDERVAKTQRCVDTGRVVISYNAPVDGENVTVNLLQINPDEIQSDVPLSCEETRVLLDNSKSNKTSASNPAGGLNEILSDLQTLPCSDCESPICNVPIVTVTSSTQLGNTTIPEQLHREISKEWIQNQDRRECFRTRSPKNLLRASGRRRIRANSIPECEELEDYNFDNITYEDEASCGPSPIVARKNDNILEVTETDDFFDFFRNRAHDEHYAHILDSDSDNEQECAKAAVEYLLNARRTSVDTLMTQLSDEPPSNRSKRSSEVGSFSTSNINSRRESIIEEQEEKIQDDIFDYFGDREASDVKKLNCAEEDGETKNALTNKHETVFDDSESAGSTHSISVEAEVEVNMVDKNDSEITKNSNAEEKTSISSITETCDDQRSSTSLERTLNKHGEVTGLLAPEKPPRTFSASTQQSISNSALETKEELASTSTKPGKSSTMDSNFNSSPSNERKSSLEDDNDIVDYSSSSIENKREAHQANAIGEPDLPDTKNVVLKEVGVQVSRCTDLYRDAHSIELPFVEGSPHLTKNTGQQELLPTDNASELNETDGPHFISERRKSFLDVDETDDIFETFEKSQNVFDQKIETQSNALKGEVSSEVPGANAKVSPKSNYDHCSIDSASTGEGREDDENLCAKLAVSGENKLHVVNESSSDVKTNGEAIPANSSTEITEDYVMKTSDEPTQNVSSNTEKLASDEHLSLERLSGAVSDSHISGTNSRPKTILDVEGTDDSYDYSFEHARPSLLVENSKETIAVENLSNITTASVNQDIFLQNESVEKDQSESILIGDETRVITTDNSEINETGSTSMLPMSNSKLSIESEHNLHQDFSFATVDLKVNNQQILSASDVVPPEVLNISEVVQTRSKSFLEIDASDDIFECFDNPDTCEYPSVLHEIDLADASFEEPSREFASSGNHNINNSSKLHQRDTLEIALVENVSSETYEDNEHAKRSETADGLGVAQHTNQNFCEFDDNEKINQEHIVKVVETPVIIVTENEDSSRNELPVEDMDTPRIGVSDPELKSVGEIENTDSCDHASIENISSCREKSVLSSIGLADNASVPKDERISLDPQKNDPKCAPNVKRMGMITMETKLDVPPTLPGRVSIDNERTNLCSFTTDKLQLVNRQCKSGMESYMFEEETNDRNAENPGEHVKLSENNSGDMHSGQQKSLNINEDDDSFESFKEKRNQVGDEINSDTTYLPVCTENSKIPIDFEEILEENENITESANNEFEIHMFSKLETRKTSASDEIMNSKNRLVSSNETSLNVLTDASGFSELDKNEKENQREAPFISRQGAENPEEERNKSINGVSKVSPPLGSMVISNHQRSIFEVKNEEFDENYYGNPNSRADGVDGKVSKINYYGRSSNTQSSDKSFTETSTADNVEIDDISNPKSDVSSSHYESITVESTNDRSNRETASPANEKHEAPLYSVPVIIVEAKVGNIDKKVCKENLMADEGLNENKVITCSKEEKVLNNEGFICNEHVDDSDSLESQKTSGAENWTCNRTLASKSSKHDPVLNSPCQISEDKTEDSIIVVESHDLNARRRSFLDIDETDDIFKCFENPESDQSNLTTRNKPERNASVLKINSNYSEEISNKEQENNLVQRTSVVNTAAENTIGKSTPEHVPTVKSILTKHSPGSPKVSSMVDANDEGSASQAEYKESATVGDVNSKDGVGDQAKYYIQYAMNSASNITSDVLDDFREKVIKYGLSETKNIDESGNSSEKAIEAASDHLSTDQNDETYSSSNNTLSASYSRSSVERSSIDTEETTTLINLPQIRVKGPPQYLADNDDFFDYFQDFAPEENCSARDVCVDNCQPACSNCKKPEVNGKVGGENTSLGRTSDSTMFPVGDTSNFAAEHAALADLVSNNVTCGRLHPIHSDDLVSKQDEYKDTAFDSSDVEFIQKERNDDQNKLESSSTYECNETEPSSAIDILDASKMYENFSKRESGAVVQTASSIMSTTAPDLETNLINEDLRMKNETLVKESKVTRINDSDKPEEAPIGNIKGISEINESDLNTKKIKINEANWKAEECPVFRDEFHTANKTAVEKQLQNEIELKKLDSEQHDVGLELSKNKEMLNQCNTAIENENKRENCEKQKVEEDKVERFQCEEKKFQQDFEEIRIDRQRKISKKVDYDEISDVEDRGITEDPSPSATRVRRSGAPFALLRRDSEKKLIPQSIPCCPICVDEVSTTLYNLSNRGTYDVKSPEQNEFCLESANNKSEVEMQRSECMKPPFPPKPFTTTSWERPELTNCINTRSFIIQPTVGAKRRFTVNKVAFYSNVMTSSKPPRKYSSPGGVGRKTSTGAIPRILGLLKKRNSESSILAPSQKKLRPTRSVIESPSKLDKTKIRRSKSVSGLLEDFKEHWKSTVQKSEDSSLSITKSVGESYDGVDNPLSDIGASAHTKSMDNIKISVEPSHQSSEPKTETQDSAGTVTKGILHPAISVSHETLLDPDDEFDKCFQKPDPNLAPYCHARKALFPNVSTSDLSSLEQYDENFTPRSLALGKPTIVLQTWRERQSIAEPIARPASSTSDLTKLFSNLEASSASSTTVGRSASFSPVTKKDTPSPSTPVDQYKEDTDGHQLRHEERIQKDRSIDVYPETLRQRQRNMAPSPSKVDIKNWNQNEVPVRESSSPSGGKKFLPSVKALRSQFETGKPPNSGSSNGSVSPVSTLSNSSNGHGVRPSNRGDSATMLSRKLSGSSLASSSLEKSSSNTSLNSAPSSENLLDGELTNEPVEPIFCQFQKVDEELRELMSRPTSTSGWDPRLVLKRLYYIPEMPRAHSKGNSYVNIEGFLEKLPSGRKKATFWNAWKKRYFVAKDGVLYYYQNSQCDKPSLRLTLMGGKVETMEANMVGVDDGPHTAEDNSDKMIGVDDGKGHYVVMRCSSKSEAERWRKALETHLVEDFASQYVQPHPMTTNPTLLRDTLIIDIGSCSIRAGVLASQATLPQVFFPTVLATDRESRRQYWGPEALSPEVRSSSSISFPIRPSHRISKYTVDLTAVSSLLSKVFSELKVDPRSYNLQISVPRVLNQHTQSELIKILFEKFGVKGVNITHQSILALYAYNATSGIVVDIGERMDIIPVTDGYIIDGGVSRVPYGGYRILDHLRQFLHMRNVSLVNDVESYVIRHVLESACYCAQHYNTEKARCSKNPENFEKSVSLQEFFSNLAQCPYESVELDFGRFQATEGIFNPDAWGLDHPGLHKLVHKAIQECSMDIRKEMSRSIFLAGGVTQLPGLADRLTAELDNLTPPAIRPKVHVSPYRYHAAFIGACTLAESSAFAQSVVTKESWLKNGNAALRKWAL
ncbi:Pleckstrin domain [Trinorchestia longiramus]|nr:Pleckstrin domain [Trinorchestia longiramus]